MNLLFWNINKKPLANEIKSLCDCYNVDILILAENEMQDRDILPILNQNSNRIFIAPFNPSTKISFYTRIHDFELICDSEYWGSIRKIIHPSGIEILLVAVHIKSKLRSNEEEQAALSTRINKEINKYEQQQGHTRTIVIGDFNMNPFETGMVSADGFHGVMDKQTALKNSRIIQGQKRKYFYNPMWSRLGDESEGQTGTHYYNSSGMIEYFWHTLDQVLLRPSLLPFYHQNNLKVIDEINGQSLIKRGKVLKYFSDHLPIMVKLTIPNLIGDK
jgi:hypothetical protein